MSQLFVKTSHSENDRFHENENLMIHWKHFHFGSSQKNQIMIPSFSPDIVNICKCLLGIILLFLQQRSVDKVHQSSTTCQNIKHHLVFFERRNWLFWYPICILKALKMKEQAELSCAKLSYDSVHLIFISILL